MNALWSTGFWQAGFWQAGFWQEDMSAWRPGRFVGTNSIDRRFFPAPLQREFSGAIFEPEPRLIEVSAPERSFRG